MARFIYLTKDVIDLQIELSTLVEVTLGVGRSNGAHSKKEVHIVGNESIWTNSSNGAYNAIRTMDLVRRRTGRGTKSLNPVLDDLPYLSHNFLSSQCVSL